jgi:hypothetical protein
MKAPDSGNIFNWNSREASVHDPQDGLIVQVVLAWATAQPTIRAVALVGSHAIDPETFAGEVWRIARKGREALRGSTANGRWSPSSGEFEVLYARWNAPARAPRSDIGFRWNRSGRAASSMKRT